MKILLYIVAAVSLVCGIILTTCTVEGDSHIKFFTIIHSISGLCLFVGAGVCYMKAFDMSENNKKPVQPMSMKEKLKRDLEEALKSEDYIAAAKLRDQLNKIKK